MTKASILGLIRHVLTFGGGYAVAIGLADEALTTELIGAAVTIIGGIWSIANKVKK